MLKRLYFNQKTIGCIDLVIKDWMTTFKQTGLYVFIESIERNQKENYIEVTINYCLKFVRSKQNASSKILRLS